MTRISLGSLLLMVSAAGAGAQTGPNPVKHDPKPTVAAITPADLMSRVYIFADDSMLGREAGTPAHLKGTEYIERELRRIGLEPAGDNGSFFQEFGLETIQPQVTVSVAGEALVQGADYLAFPFVQLPAIGAPFNAENVNVVFGGKLGTPNLVAPDAVVGKLALFLPADGGAGWQFWSRFGPPQYQRYAGAKGLIIAALDVTPTEVRGLLQGEGQMRIAGQGELQKGEIPTMFVSRSAAEKMMGGPVTGILPGAEGKPVTAKGWFGPVPTPAPARNVVALVRGSDATLKSQYVVFGAHSDHDGIRSAVEHDSLRAFNTVVRPGGAEDTGKQPTAQQAGAVRAVLDSLRQAGPGRVDSIMNGADDDASGSMALLELAEFFAKNPARRSLLFVWHTAEEKGLFGSAWYTDHPTVPRDSMVAALNVDMIGRGGPADLQGGGPGYVQLIGSRRLSTQLGTLVEEVNVKGNHGFTFDYQYDADGHPQQFYCRSDHYNYARYGIPVVFFSTGSHRDYHMVTDEPQYLDYEKLAKVTSLIGDVGKTVANLDQRPVVDKPKPDPKGECKQ
ncbi:MAG TPA: M28 family peptidase [Gemmatimonadales bacterium]